MTTKGGEEDGSVSSYGGSLMSYDSLCVLEDECNVSRYLRLKTPLEMEQATSSIVKLNSGKRRRRQQNSSSHPISSGADAILWAPLHYANSKVSLTLSSTDVDADLIEMLGKTPDALENVQGRKPAATPKGVPHDVERYFVRHAHAKGWVECVACGELQWPPNREKHLAKCAAFLKHMSA